MAQPTSALANQLNSQGLSASLGGVAGAPGKKFAFVVPGKRLTLPAQNDGTPKQPLSLSVFNKYDVDDNAAISPEEFRFLVYDMGHHLNEKELDFAFKRIDSNGDGQVSYDEFLKWWKNEERFQILQLTEQEQETLQEAIATFSQFDENRNGVISREEFAPLHAHLTALGLTTKSLETCLEDLDSDRNNEISFNEYVEWTIRIGATKVKLPAL
eukprot:TRINITY_DN772_c0_g1_i1.p1 TRINITY_DN772_c0_g1~~TRINITY_DN772_c0_g1_i1.p1  ORF type:complete len:213 (-),score=116.71 TRINITY_DN772_c0_g1_i1:119-757(-)